MDGIFGGNGQNGTVSVRGKDGQPLVELLGRDNEAAIGAGQTGRPARISLYNEHAQEALRLQTSPQPDVVVGGQSVQARLAALEGEVVALQNQLKAQIDVFNKHQHRMNFSGFCIFPGTSSYYALLGPRPNCDQMMVQPPGSNQF